MSLSKKYTTQNGGLFRQWPSVCWSYYWHLDVRFLAHGILGNILIAWVSVSVQMTSGELFVNRVNVETTAFVIRVCMVLAFVRVIMDGRVRNVTAVMTVTSQSQESCPHVLCVRQDSPVTNVNSARLGTLGKIVRPVTPAGTHGNLLPHYFQTLLPMTIDIFVTNAYPTTGGSIVDHVRWAMMYPESPWPEITH